MPSSLWEAPAIEGAQGELAPLPLEGPHDQIRIHTRHPRGIEGGVAGPAAAGARRDPAEGEALCLQVLGHAAPARAGVAARRGADTLELLGHLLGQALHCAGGEEVRGIALDEAREHSRVQRVAVHVGRGEAGAVVEGQVVTRVAARGVRAGGAAREVIRPLAGPVEVGARDPREALPVSDVGADPVERVEDRLEELVPLLEGQLEGLVEVPGADQGDELVLLGVLGGGLVQALGERELFAPCGGGGEQRESDHVRSGRTAQETQALICGHVDVPPRFSPDGEVSYGPRAPCGDTDHRSRGDRAHTSRRNSTGSRGAGVRPERARSVRRGARR
jgi:hypothetical protein